MSRLRLLLRAHVSWHDFTFVVKIYSIYFELVTVSILGFSVLNLLELSGLEFVLPAKSLHLNKSWIFNCMRKADKNDDNKMSLKELKHFLRQINVEVDDSYAEQLFKVRPLFMTKSLSD